MSSPLQERPTQSGPRMSLGSLLEPVPDELAQVDELMAGAIDSYAGDGLLRDMLRGHMATGGKRTRARLALSAVLGLGGESRLGVGWAAACELLHNATLVHDDIQDGDEVRRGAPALWVRHGVGQAINAGDALLLLPMSALELADGYDDQLRWRLTACLTRRAIATAAGQSLEMSLLGRIHPGVDNAWAQYEAAAHGKTGQLFALPVEGAALVAGLDPSRARAVADAVSDVGLLYQIHDDVRGLYGTQSGRLSGNDLQEGRVTALVAAHADAFPEESAELVSALRSDALVTPSFVAGTRARFAAAGTLGDVVERGRRLAERVVVDPVLTALPGLNTIVARLAAVLATSLDTLLAEHTVLR